MLNCKQGDLAIIVKSVAGNEGKIVRCLQLIKKIWLHPDGSKQLYDSWVIDIRLRVHGGDFTNSIPDFQLRPIRDTDQEDEILRLVGKPQKETSC